MIPAPASDHRGRFEGTRHWSAFAAENIDTMSATGRLVLHIFAALGQFEVEVLRERTRTALAASRVRGRIGGRPPALNAIKVKAAKAMLASAP